MIKTSRIENGSYERYVLELQHHLIHGKKTLAMYLLISNISMKNAEKYLTTGYLIQHRGFDMACLGLLVILIIIIFSKDLMNHHKAAFMTGIIFGLTAISASLLIGLSAPGIDIAQAQNAVHYREALELKREHPNASPSSQIAKTYRHLMSEYHTQKAESAMSIKDRGLNAVRQSYRRIF